MLVGKASKAAPSRARRKARAQVPAREAAALAHGIACRAPRGAGAAASGRDQAASTIALCDPVSSPPCAYTAPRTGFALYTAFSWSLGAVSRRGARL